jgi:hypothetical protein
MVASTFKRLSLSVALQREECGAALVNEIRERNLNGAQIPATRTANAQLCASESGNRSIRTTRPIWGHCAALPRPSVWRGGHV